MAALMFIVVVLTRPPKPFEEYKGEKKSGMTEGQAIRSIVYTRPFMVVVFSLYMSGFNVGQNPTLTTIVLKEVYDFDERGLALYLLIAPIFSMTAIVLAYKKLMKRLKPWLLFVVFCSVSLLVIMSYYFKLGLSVGGYHLLLFRACFNRVCK